MSEWRQLHCQRRLSLPPSRMLSQNTVWCVNYCSDAKPWDSQKACRNNNRIMERVLVGVGAGGCSLRVRLPPCPPTCTYLPSYCSASGPYGPLGFPAPLCITSLPGGVEVHEKAFQCQLFLRTSIPRHVYWNEPTAPEMRPKLCG